MKKRIIALLLTVIMVCTLLPLAAFADNAEIIASGGCGENTTWTLDANGLLIVSGTGVPNDGWPFRDYASSIKRLVIEEGIAAVGDCFGNLYNLQSVVIPDSAVRIDEDAFYNCKNLVNLTIGDGVRDIYDHAFANCSSLKVINLGKNVSYISGFAFSGFSGADVYYAGTKTQRSKIEIDGGNAGLTNATWHYQHVHNLVAGDVVAPTCTDLGYTEYNCSLGETIKDYFVPALGHTAEIVPGYPATYDAEGLTDGKYCSVCGKTLTAQKPIPKLVDYINDLHVNDLDAPKAGQKLDYDFTVTTTSEGRIITEGEQAPVIEWYVYNDYTCEWDYIDDPDYVCVNARAYSAEIYLTPEEHCAFKFSGTGTDRTFSGSIYADGTSLREGYPTDDGLCLDLLYYNYPSDSTHRVKNINFENMPYECIEGEAVKDFKPATLKGDGTAHEYFWYLAKYDKNEDIVGVYIPASQEATALKVMPELTASDIADARSEFGATFQSGYIYVLYNLEILHEGYAYIEHDCVNIYVTFIDGETAYDGFDNDVDMGVRSVYMLPIQLDTVKITKPSAPKLSLTKTDGKVKLSWNAVAGADKYQVWRSTDGKNYSLLSTVTGTSLTNSKVTSGTKYYYKVRAVNIDGNTTYYSNYSSVKSTVPLTTPTLTAKLSADSAKLSWDAVGGAAKYNIYRSTDGSTYKLLTSTTKTSYTNSSLTAGTTYYYKIKAVKTVGSTDYTSSYSAVQSVKILKAPTLSLTKTDGKVKLSWNAVDGAVKYQVARSTDGKTYKILSTVTGTSLTNTSVTSGTKYYYKVRPVDANGCTGSYSSVKTATPLSTPTLTAKLSAGSVKLSWTAVTGATKYQVYSSTDGVTFSLLSTVTGTSLTSSKVTAGTQYYYKVRAVKVVSSNTYYSSYSAVQTAAVLSAPTLSVAGTDGKVVLNWTAVDGAAKYQVARSTDGKSYTILSTVTGTELTNSKVTLGTQYYYKVRPVDANGGTGTYSNILTATPVAVPAE